MPSVAVEFEIFESVTRGGVRRVTWHVASEDDWLSVTQVPGALLEHQDRTAGVIWRRQVLVQIPIGTRLMRVESMPDRAAPEDDPMAYLWQTRRGVGRKVKRNYFRVGPGGKLVRDSASEK